jgi:hypothetical protein
MQSIGGGDNRMDGTIGWMGNTTRVRGGRLPGVGQQDPERNTRRHTYPEYNRAIVTYKEKGNSEWQIPELWRSRVQCSVTEM